MGDLAHSDEPLKDDADRLSFAVSLVQSMVTLQQHLNRIDRHELIIIIVSALLLVISFDSFEHCVCFAGSSTVCLFVCLYICACVCLFVCLVGYFVCLLICVCVFVSWLSGCCLCLSACLLICLYV